MNNKFDLTGKTALITGGGSGLGYGIAEVFVEAGAKVIIVGQNLEKLKNAQLALGESCTYFRMDITRQSEIPAMVEQIETEHGPIDILVNNAGKHLKKPVIETSDEEYLSVLQVHLLASFTLTREVGKRMMARDKGGSIILISSMSAVMSMDRVVAYSTAKTALLGLMRGVIAEFAPYDIRVNAIAPGWIETPMLHVAIDTDSQRKQKIMNRIPSHTFGHPRDIGYAALYLSSEAGRYVNGVFLPVDGGAASGF